MPSFSVPVSASGLAVIAMLIITGDLPSTNAAAFQHDPDLYYQGSVDGTSFYAGRDIQNATREEAIGFCEAHNVRLPSLEMESHWEFWDQQITSNVSDGLGPDAADPDRLRLFWLSNQTDVSCEAAFVVREGAWIRFQRVWNICSGLAAIVICEGDE